MPSGVPPEPHPFLFYGARPADWFEGANCGHAYALRFRSPPSPEERLAIARAFESALAGSAVETACRAFRWKDTWLMCTVGEAHVGGSAARFFEAMERALLAVHAAPGGGLEAAVFLGEREPGREDRWSRWSAQRAERPVPPAWESGAVDAACEAERERVRSARSGELLARGAEARAGSGKVALVPAEVPPLGGVFVTASGAKYRFTREGSVRVLEVDTDGQWRKLSVGLHEDSVRIHAPSPDGRSLLVGVKGLVREVDLGSGKSEDLLNLRIPVRGVAWLDNGLIAAVTDAETFLLSVADRSQVRFLRQVAFGGTGLFSMLGGTVVAIVSKYAPSPVTLFARQGTQLYRMAALKSDVDTLFERDGRVFATSGGQGFELVNLEATRDRVLREPPEMEELQYLDSDAEPYDDA